MDHFLLILRRLTTTRVAWPIIITVGLLCTTSLLALQLADPGRAQGQKTWILAGVGILIIALIPHFQLIGRMSYAAFGIAILLLLAVLLAPKIANTHRWFKIGSVQLQPSEFAKIAYVLAMAWYLRYRKSIHQITGLFVPFLLTLVPFALILVEPDLGTALLFPMVLYAMLIAAGARLRDLFLIAFIALLAMPGAYPLLRPYQQERVKSFVYHLVGIENANRAQDEDYQQLHSVTAIGSGGVTGLGEQGAQRIRSRRFLPEHSTDFIFAVIGIQWGFLGCLLILVFYLLFFAASVEIAASTKDNFGRLLVVGLSAMILFQALINMFMTVRLGPVVGIALPFLSYGGSSLLTSMVAAGLLLNVSMRRQTRSAAVLPYPVRA